MLAFPQSLEQLWDQTPAPPTCLAEWWRHQEHLHSSRGAEPPGSWSFLWIKGSFHSNHYLYLKLIKRNCNSKLTEPSQTFARCPPNREFRGLAVSEVARCLMKLSGTEVCVHLFYVCTHTCACVGREMPWGPWALLGAPGKAAQGSCTGWAAGPAPKSFQQHHLFRTPQQAPPAFLPSAEFAVLPCPHFMVTHLSGVQLCLLLLK